MPQAGINDDYEMPLPMPRISNDELAALRADKARLDFLLAGGHVESEDGPVRRYSVLHYKPTREQIDAAMRKR